MICTFFSLNVPVFINISFLWIDNFIKFKNLTLWNQKCVLFLWLVIRPFSLFYKLKFYFRLDNLENHNWNWDFFKIFAFRQGSYWPLIIADKNSKWYLILYHGFLYMVKQIISVYTVLFLHHTHTGNHHTLKIINTFLQN